MANGKQVEGLPGSPPGDRPARMALSVGEPISAQIIPGNRLRDAHSYSLRAKRAVVKFAFPSFSCHWAEKYELWVDAPGWEPVACWCPPPQNPPGPCPPLLLRLQRSLAQLYFLIFLFPASAPFAASLFPLHLFLSHAGALPLLWHPAQRLVQSGRAGTHCRTNRSPCISLTWRGRKSRTGLASHRGGKTLLVQWS